MEVSYIEYKMRGGCYLKEEEQRVSVEQYVIDQTIYEERRGDTNRVHLEEQPKKVCELVGRFLNVMLEKNLLTKEDFCNILWGYSPKDIQLKREDEHP